ncbi:MAG TPA: hypothetical protein VHO66_01070, partial [Ruminiclostridium sp.]|nr:hypothetical protein [Ruminiclostridium sp.]
MDFEEFLNAGKHFYGNTHEPIALTDAYLNVCWANEEALSRYPTLTLQNGVLELVNNYSPDKVISFLKTGKTFDGKKQAEPFSNLSVQIVPVMDKDKLIGCNVFLKNSVNDNGTFPDGHPEKIIASFSNEYKIPLTVIFSTLGLMARHLDDSNDEITKAYIKLITQNSYRILRLSNNLAEVSRYRSGISKINLKKGNLT